MTSLPSSTYNIIFFELVQNFLQTVKKLRNVCIIAHRKALKERKKMEKKIVNLQFRCICIKVRVF